MTKEIISMYIFKRKKELLISLFFSYCCVFAYAKPCNSNSNFVTTFVLNGQTDTTGIKYLENIPVVYLKGSGYEAGLQHGKLLEKSIHSVVESINNIIFKTNTSLGKMLYKEAVENVMKFDKLIPEIYRDEMHGIAKGSNTNYIDILIINTYDDLLNLFGCASFAIAKTNKSSMLIHARNLDYLFDFLADKNVVYHYLDKHFISIGFPGYIGVLTGTNYAGISFSSHTSYTSNKGTFGVPSGIVYREIMEKAKTINDVDSILKISQKTIANNILITSLSENATAVFEITYDRVVRRKTDNYSISTNHFVSSDLDDVAIRNPASIKRYNFLDSVYQQTPSIDFDKMKATISYFDNNPYGWTSVANKGTVQSVIFLPGKKMIYIAKGTITPVNQAGFVKYEYSQFVNK